MTLLFVIPSLIQSQLVHLFYLFRILTQSKLLFYLSIEIGKSVEV